jgi:hypothetical protein
VARCAGSALLLVLRCAHADSSWWHVSAALDYTPNGTQHGLTNTLISSNNCAGCHQGYNNAANFFPWSTWSGTMMANATRDPVFWAALDVANNDLAGVGDYCLRCHAPAGWYGGRVVKTGTGSTIDGSNGCLLQGDYTSGDDGDYSGESCHFCHRLMAQGPRGQPAYTGNADVWLDDQPCATNIDSQPCRRGPYNYPAGSPVAPPPHDWAYSAYHEQSAICGNCHNVSTPDTSAGPLKTLIDTNGVDTGIPFPAERTFSEWQQSDFADLIFRDGLGDVKFTPALTHSRQCQDCHMPTSTDPTAYACVQENPGVRANNLALHSIVGGNSWVPAILGGEYGGALSRVPAFAQTAAAAVQMQQGAAQVAISPGKFILPTQTVAGTLALNVSVTNLSGHKLPTGYAEGRRMWIDVQIRDASNNLLAESGAYNTATGVLTQDTQARVYEILQGIWDSGSGSCQITDSDGNLQFHFVLNNCIAKDNRIPPLGFFGGSNLETMPVGQSFPVVGARMANYDNVPYNFSIPAATALPVQVSVSVYYQTASLDYIAFLAGQAQQNAFADENTLCAGDPGRPFTVGPQGRSRGLYLDQLWTNAPNDPTQPGYGKSPPQPVGNVATITLGN